VKQACRLEIDEEGTTAAAVTSIEAMAVAAPPPAERFEMVLNHPFLLGIQDARTRAMLFLAAVSDPLTK
jgi:serpin B